MPAFSNLVKIMRALQLIQDLCPNTIPVEVGQFLGEGADGDVYQIKSDPDKVIKLSKLYDSYSYKDLDATYSGVVNVLSYLEHNPTSIFARVYSHGYMGTFDRKQLYSINGKEFSRKQKFILYYYTMEKLNKISEDELRIFHSIISHEDRGYPKNYSLDKISEMLIGMQRHLDFDKQKVMMFCTSIKNAEITHCDIHERNIMKDNSGNFKLVDFDRVSADMIHLGECYGEK